MTLRETAHIEGRPRIEAIRTYLGQHGITLPEGSLHQAPGYDTVGALANLKNQFFLNVIETYGVSLFDSTIELIHQLRARSIKVGLVTSSLNARMILNAAAIPDLFEVVVDGEVAASSGLAGKPAPDTFLAACQKLGVSPAQAIVVEDAVSGVKAASQGGFGLVVGLARGKNPAALIENGADVVFSDFAETDLPKLIRLIESKHAAQASVR